MGQLLLFWVLTKGPAYIIFPIICLSPVVTIILCTTLLKERPHRPSLIQPEVHSQVILRKVAPASMNLFRLRGSCSYSLQAGSNRQSIALYSRQFKNSPNTFPQRRGSSRITPPLIDSITIFFSGSDVCWNVMPALLVTSSS